jgi:glycosyltransferase involved in cell wall biosynthesis
MAGSAMRILVLYLLYLRPGDSGIRRFNEFARLWSEEPGVEVTVITGMVHHHTRQLYPDLRGQALAEEADGPVRVLRVSQPDTYHKGFSGRAWSQAMWARNASSRLRRLDLHPDVIIASSPPLWVAWPMFAAKKRFGVPAVLEIRDLWPESIIQAGLASRVHPGVQYLGWLEKRACRAADHIVTIVPTMNNSLVRRGLKAPEDITLVTNGVVLEDFDSVDGARREEIRGGLGLADDQKLVVYIGQHGYMQRIVELVNVAEAMQHRRDIQFVTFGDGPERPALMAEAARRGLTNLRFMGRIPTTDVPAHLEAADIGVCFVNTGPGTNWDNSTRGVFRNAFFDLAGARLPVVFNIPGFPVDEIQDRAGGGIYASTNDGPGEFCEKIQYLADNPTQAREMGERNYAEIAVRYNRRKMAATYLDLLHRLSGR